MRPLSASIWPLWLELGRSRAAELELDVVPWESSTDSVKAAWARLIQPANLEALEALSLEASEMNPSATAAVSKALEMCRRLSRNPPPTPDSPPSTPRG